MLQLNEKIYQQNQMSKAFQEWRDAANAWSDFFSLLKQDADRISFEQSKRLRVLKRQLNKASDEYMRIRILTKLGRPRLGGQSVKVNCVSSARDGMG